MTVRWQRVPFGGMPMKLPDGSYVERDIVPMKHNPYEYDGWWYWSDDLGGHHGPYAGEREALLYLLKHTAPAPWHQRLWRTLKRLWRDTCST